MWTWPLVIFCGREHAAHQSQQAGLERNQSLANGENAGDEYERQTCKVCTLKP